MKKIDADPDVPEVDEIMDDLHSRIYAILESDRLYGDTDVCTICLTPDPDQICIPCDLLFHYRCQNNNICDPCGHKTIAYV